MVETRKRLVQTKLSAASVRTGISQPIECLAIPEPSAIRVDDDTRKVVLCWMRTLRQKVGNDFSELVAADYTKITISVTYTPLDR